MTQLIGQIKQGTVQELVSPTSEWSGAGCGQALGERDFDSCRGESFRLQLRFNPVQHLAASAFSTKGLATYGCRMAVT